MAVLIYFLFAMGVPYFPFRPFAIIGAFGAVPAALLIFGRNAFGIRRKQKRAYISAFEATQPCSTAQLAGVKLIVRTACVLVALLAIGGSAWTSSSLMNAWGPWSAKDTHDMTQKMLHNRSSNRTDFVGTGGYELAVQVVNTLVFVIGVVVALAAISALGARYPRRLRVTGLLLLLWFLALQFGTEFSAARSLLGDAVDRRDSDVVDDHLLPVERIQGARADDWLRVRRLRDRGRKLSAIPAWSLDNFLVTLLLPLLPCVLAPWALNRIRHT